MEWKEAEATLQTEVGKKMAQDPYKEDLPLHMACERKAPDSLILALLENHREAAGLPGRYGGYPLHLAAQQKLSPTVLVALIRAHPEALDQEDDANNLPRDYNQRNDLSREALSRPTACWIEDVEKEEYLDRVDRKKVHLRQKIETLRSALDVSNRRQEQLQEKMRHLEPRMQAQRQVLERLAQLEKQMEEIRLNNRWYVEGVHEQIKALSDEVTVENDEDDMRMRSLMRRTYMQSVQRQYEKLIGRTDQMRKDIKSLRVELSQRNGFVDEEEEEIRELQ